MRRTGPILALGMAAAAACAAVGIVALVVWAPGFFPHEGNLSDGQRAAEVSRNRTAVLASLAGAIAIVSAVYTALGHGLARRGQISERFFKAVEHLDHEGKGSLRLGAVYALRAIARDSRTDEQAVLNVLEAYVERAGAPTAEGRPDVDAAVETIELMGGTVPPLYRQGTDSAPPDAAPPSFRSLFGGTLWNRIPPIWKAFASLCAAIGAVALGWGASLSDARGMLSLSLVSFGAAIALALRALPRTPGGVGPARLIRTDVDEAIRSLRAEIDETEARVSGAMKNVVAVPGLQESRLQLERARWEFERLQGELRKLEQERGDDGMP